MADSVVVLLSRNMLPSVGDIANALLTHGFPLTDIAPWDWDEHVGWLPMNWDGEDSGFELEIIEPAETSSLSSPASSREFDCEVRLETRGYRSLQCGAAFAVVVAGLAAGVVYDDAKELRSPSELISWAKEIISASEKEISSERRRIELAATLDSPSRIAESFQALLATMIGRTATFPTVESSIKGEHYSMHLRTDSLVQCYGLSWRLIIDGRVFDKTKHSAAQDEYMRALHRWYEQDGFTVGDPIPGRYRLEYESLKADLESSEEADDLVGREALQLVVGWSDAPKIAGLKWLPPHTVEIELSGETGRIIQYVGGGQQSAFSVSSPELHFQIDERIRLL